ncbi:hypothetical protein BB560_002036 [Smittium megazygosporum]|uniref:Mitochondrial distribution and morphology protein 31 n=1 Tax=Smittium megazygosporum TaxID=133381 RepID=A0A2T9ZG16_9FUNG|nr:hypothetical protein BB560_002036 [Smittium megazygosporum]
MYSFYRQKIKSTSPLFNLLPKSVLYDAQAHTSHPRLSRKASLDLEYLDSKSLKYTSKHPLSEPLSVYLNRNKRTTKYCNDPLLFKHPNILLNNFRTSSTSNFPCHFNYVISKYLIGIYLAKKAHIFWNFANSLDAFFESKNQEKKSNSKSEFNLAGLLVFLAGFETVSNKDQCAIENKIKFSDFFALKEALGIDQAGNFDNWDNKTINYSLEDNRICRGKVNSLAKRFYSSGARDIKKARFKRRFESINPLQNDYFKANKVNVISNSVSSAKSQAKATKSLRLAESSSRFRRLGIHLQFILRGGSSGKPWTLDDVFALGSWLIMSNALWILVGTTTFVSVVLFILNNLNFQNSVNKLVSSQLSKSLGITVTIESSIWPKWKAGVITLKNTLIECGPQHALPSASPSADPKNPKEDSLDTNYAYYKIRVGEVDIELSLVRWIDGKGLVKNCFFKGVRGVIDQRHIIYDSSEPYTPSDIRALHKPGYFDFNSVGVEDCMFTMLYPNFKPVSIAIHYGKIGRLRQQWFFYDIMKSYSIVGMYDNSLFSIRRLRRLPQNTTFEPSNPVKSSGEKYSGDKYGYESLDRVDNYTLDLLFDEIEDSLLVATEFKIDNLDISHLNYGVDGPMGWITSGRVDIDSVLLFPSESNLNPSMLIEKIVSDLSTAIDVVVLPSRNEIADVDYSENPLLKFLFNVGFFDTKIVTQIKQKIKENNEAEMERRLRLQRERIFNWRTENNYSNSESVFEDNSTKSAPGQMSNTNLNTSKNYSSDDTLENNVHLHKGTGTGKAKQLNNFHSTLQSNPKGSVFIDLNVEFNNIRAKVPIVTPHLSYVNSALLIRPIVGYMNSHRVNIPIKCTLKLDIDNFDGAWHAYDSGVVELLSKGMGLAFEQLIQDEAERKHRLKKWKLKGGNTKISGANLKSKIPIHLISIKYVMCIWAIP